MSIRIKGVDSAVSLSEAKRLVDEGSARIVRGTASQLEMLNTEARKAVREQRGWKDNHPFPYGPWFHPPSPVNDGLLTPSIMRRMHRKSAAMRPVVSFLVRTLSTTPWRIIAQPGVPKRDFNFAVDLFTHPGPGAKTFREVLAKVLTDLFVLDSIYIEKIRAVGSSIIEFAPRDPATFDIVPGDHGEILGYTQRVINKEGVKVEPVEFAPEDIAHTVFYGRTDSYSGTPPAEAIVNEISALMMASRAIASFFSDDELPLGILHLGDVGREAYTRAKADFETTTGTKAHRSLRTIYGRGDPKWVQFQRPWREMEIAQIMPRIERIVFRNFGVTPLDLGMSQDVNRSTADAFKEIRTFTLFKPILDLLAEMFTFEILHEINPGLFLEFQHFLRTGEDEGTGAEDNPVSTDIPGEGEGAKTESSPGKSKKSSKKKKVEEEEDRMVAMASPLFGSYGKIRGYTYLTCRPPVLPVEHVEQKPISAARMSDDEILNLVATPDVMEALERGTAAGNETISVLLEETYLELQEAGNLELSEVRVIAEGSVERILEQLEGQLKNVEEVAASAVYRSLGTVAGHREQAEVSLRPYAEKLRELAVKQLLHTSVPAVEEAGMVRAFDTVKLDVSSLVREVAVAPYRTVLNFVDSE